MIKISDLGEKQMFKIRYLKFVSHPILGNLMLDFCDEEGKAIDTIIIAGENGTGKSTILNTLYQVASHDVKYPLEVGFENGDKAFSISYEVRQRQGHKDRTYVNDGQGMNSPLILSNIEKKYPFSGIFSDVDINFHAEKVSSVTSMTLDSEVNSRRSNTSLPNQIKQLLVDIQAVDDGELARAYRNASMAGKDVARIVYEERIPRFTNAFNKMFENLTYSRVENKDSTKNIVFQKNGIDIPIDSLSSGEKQIVYRGCFLLKDVNATKGAFVFIDEPEISLHPKWQMKIMDYYKGIFADKKGKQTSQIFAVTHSPFIIHNECRINDKILVLSRNTDGNVYVMDKPEYYNCRSIEVVEDAFYLKSFSVDKPTVYVEGRTDEKYFNKAIEVFKISVPFQFKWVGYLDDRGQEVNTGSSAIGNAFHFLASKDLGFKNICLKDCDTNCQKLVKNNTIIMSTKRYNNIKSIQKGIENALVFDDIDLTPFYSVKEKIGSYGEKTRIETFDKMECCKVVCEMDENILKKVFVNLKEIIEELIEVYDSSEN